MIYHSGQRVALEHTTDPHTRLRRIRDDGTGGATERYAAHPPFGRRQMAAYVTDCRHRRQPASEDQVFDALVAEYAIDRALRAAEAAGGLLARLVDADGRVVCL